ncbi:sigma-54-dependent Fis family transcriptional regulator, partial [bacterium]
LAAQAKVLRALEDSRIERVGGQGAIDVDVRVVAATNRELQDEKSGFRQDLFFRLNVIAIQLPPLRDRSSDIAALFHHFLGVAASELKQEPKQVGDEVISRLTRYPWPGNVRELRNIAERLAIIVPHIELKTSDLPPGMGGQGQVHASAEFLEAPTFQEFKAASEAAYLQSRLRENEYNVSRTAERLEMQRSNLYKKIQRYGLKTSAGT